MIITHPQGEVRPQVKPSPCQVIDSKNTLKVSGSGIG